MFAMSSGTLLSFLDAPVVVGDPEGRAAYVNPAFEARFSAGAAPATGAPLASLFDGGVREAVLRAVAEVCQSGASRRFRVRHAGAGYAALASPIVAEDARVGFVIVFLETAADDERLHALAREIREPAAEVAGVLEDAAERLRSRDEAVRALLDDGQRALSRLRKAANELGELLAGRTPEPTGADPVAVARDVAALLAPDFQRTRVKLKLRLPEAGLPVGVRPRELADALANLLRARLSACQAGATVTLAGRVVERDGRRSVVVAVIDDRGPQDAPPPDCEPEAVRRAVAAMGADLRSSTDPGGCTTAIRLSVPNQ
jgi:signal transduction histidine kinase